MPKRIPHPSDGPRTTSLEGRRFSDLAELRQAVLAYCATEFARFNPMPHVAASNVGTIIESFTGNRPRNARARKILLHLATDLRSALELVVEHQRAYGGGFPGRHVDVLSQLEELLRLLDARLAGVSRGSALWAQEMGGQGTSRSPIEDLKAMPLTPRQGVLVYFAQAHRAGETSKEPSVRELAITSILAGQDVTGKNLTVSEAVTKEERAVREALRAWRRRNLWPFPSPA